VLHRSCGLYSGVFSVDGRTRGDTRVGTRGVHGGA
jgi:hypothetical protein